MHIPVLLKEVIDGLDLQSGDVVVDGTIGNAGHSVEIAKHIGKTGVLIGIDHDADALDTAQANLKEVDPETHLVEGNFRNVNTYIKELGFDNVDKILLDIGIRSDHVDSSGRGFTFMKDEPLVMTFNRDGDGITAQDIVNDWSEETLIEILKGYGEERHARRVARGIVEAREEGHITTTSELVEIVRKSLPSKARRGPIHPATRTFQAIRIAVNDEIESLRGGLTNGWDALDVGGIMAIISFHSIEDRIVKHFFKKASDAEIITKKPIYPSEEERKENPRSRSAKLRIAKKI